MRLLLVDNYDSFTFNLYQLLGEAMGLHEGHTGELRVVRNDAVSVDEALAWEPTHVVLSPGPGHPSVARDFGICADLVTRATVPLLGVCLGHQGIVHHLGGRVVKAPEIVHGKTSLIDHDGAGLFADLPADMKVMRYHSFVAERASIPASLKVTASTNDGLVMAVAHRDRPVVGVQFHPESIGTPEGRTLLTSFLEMEG